MHVGRHPLCRIGFSACGAALLALRAAGTPAATSGAVSAEALGRQAAAAERAGNREAAIAAYEALLARDTTHERAIAPRLVDLYAESGLAAQALAWAVRVARRHPDPTAYLAGVHARLGQFKEAELTLRDALRGVTGPDRRLPLLWQLAAIQEALGDDTAARRSLKEACDLAPDRARREAAIQRLDAHESRRTDGADKRKADAMRREVLP